MTATHRDLLPIASSGDTFRLAARLVTRHRAALAACVVALLDRWRWTCSGRRAGSSEATKVMPNGSSGPGTSEAPSRSHPSSSPQKAAAAAGSGARWASECSWRAIPAA